ncbi:hypothetical protein SPSIL_057140 [Sporomusa silvacetica DSM 10669]|uniref:ASCH domain-containing protein n=1 Tax=Sporomusa silvacetica DSM 10669 TaxID=1123289 RepID=A0ABZ3IV90_9FIRM|nr:hypothetical protein [Sporomusa silvacetica]OZC15191.1 hypothetical protein SPSIL_42650 [Sporomusa silvacetica DSM 10669]
MQAINFTLPESYNALQARNTVCTIRYGDITERYSEGQVINITFGDTYKKKKKVFTAYIDKVLVKPIRLLTGRELNGENHKLNTNEEFLAWYRSTFKKPMNRSDVVTVIYFSEIIG